LSCLFSASFFGSFFSLTMVINLKFTI
jgi:hypothetical protein